MNKLQKAAGLLNDKAPKGEFLAYINAKEAGLLSSKGGAGIDINNSGVPSYVDFGGGGSGYGSAQDSFDSASGNSDSGNSRSDSGGSSDDAYAQSVATNTAIAKANSQTTPSDNDDIDSQYTTGKEFEVDPTPLTVADYTKDQFLNKTIFGSKNLHRAKTIQNISNAPFPSLTGLLISGVLAKRSAEKEPDPNYATGEDGIGEGDYKSTVGDWAESRGLTDDYSKEDNETQQAIDKAAFDAGFRTEDAKDMNLTGGDNNNPPPTIDSNSAAIPDSIRTVNTAGTGLPDPSGWINSYIGSKANFQDLYNNVRNTLYSSRTQQGLLAVSDSPYYDFLKINKLDRRVL
jgi:hypothetical protein